VNEPAEKEGYFRTPENPSITSTGRDHVRWYRRKEVPIADKSTLKKITAIWERKKKEKERRKRKETQKENATFEIALLCFPFPQIGRRGTLRRV